MTDPRQLGLVDELFGLVLGIGRSRGAEDGGDAVGERLAGGIGEVAAVVERAGDDVRDARRGVAGRVERQVLEVEHGIHAEAAARETRQREALHAHAQAGPGARQEALALVVEGRELFDGELEGFLEVARGEIEGVAVLDVVEHVLEVALLDELRQGVHVAKHVARGGGSHHGLPLRGAAARAGGARGGDRGLSGLRPPSSAA